MAKTDPIGIRLEPDERTALEKAAAAEDRSMSALGRKIIAEWLRKMADQTQTTRLDHAADEVQQPTGPEVAKLVARLTSDPQRRLVIFSVFRGDGPATAEDIARECNQALSQEAAGTALVSTAFDDQRPTIDVREYLESLP